MSKDAMETGEGRYIGCLQDQIADVRAENARLQERVEKLSRGRKEAYNRMAQAQGQLEMTLETGTVAYLSWRTANDTLKRERDGYKARDKRRGEELVEESKRAHRWDNSDLCHGQWDRCTSLRCRAARAAITMTPEEAKEKERG